MSHKQEEKRKEELLTNWGELDERLSDIKAQMYLIEDELADLGFNIENLGVSDE